MYGCFGNGMTLDLWKYRWKGHLTLLPWVMRRNCSNSWASLSLATKHFPKTPYTARMPAESVKIIASAQRTHDTKLVFIANFVGVPALTIRCLRLFFSCLLGWETIKSNVFSSVNILLYVGCAKIWPTHKMNQIIVNHAYFENLRANFTPESLSKSSVWVWWKFQFLTNPK